MSNRLPILAAEIAVANTACRRNALAAAEAALRAGAALIEAKSLVLHGQWAGWLSEHCSMSERTARRYMQLTASGMKSATVAVLGIRAASEIPGLTRPGAGEIVHLQPRNLPADQVHSGYIWASPIEGFYWVLALKAHLAADGTIDGWQDTTRRPVAWHGVAATLKQLQLKTTRCEIDVVQAPDLIENLDEWRMEI